MSQSEWQLLTTVPNVASATALANALEAYGVTARIESASLLAGEALQSLVLVSSSQMHRARWFMSLGNFSDEELDFLATGRLGSEESQ